MGFWDSFGSAIGTGLEWAGGIAKNVLESPGGTQFIGDLARWGASELQGAIGMPTAGAPGRQSNYWDNWAATYSQPPTDTYTLDASQYYRMGGPGNPVRPSSLPASIPGPGAWSSSAATPASQPFGLMPGAERAPFLPAGGNMPGFPTTRYSSYPSPGVQPVSFAALAPLARQIPAFLGGMLAGEGLEGAMSMMPAPSMPMAMAGGGTPQFRATMAGARAQFFRVPNPVTGQDTWFRPAGRPILWSGDLTACKRVKKVARRAARKR
jgi:hypothetical protein